MRGLAPRSSRPLTHPGRQWTLADALRAFAIRGEMRWCGKARLHLEHNLRHPDNPLCLAAVGRIVQWGLEAGRIKPEGIGEANPCSFRCEGRAKARRRRSFAGDHAERWRGEDRHRGLQVDHMTLSIDGRVFKEFRAVRPKTRRRRAGQPNRPIRVLALPRRRTELRRHEQGPAGLPGLLQQPQAAPLAGDANARATGYPSAQGRLTDKGPEGR